MYRDKIQFQLVNICSNLAHLLNDLELNHCFENSGYKGYHLWIFANEEISAGTGKILGQLIAQQADLNNTDISIEVFPKQARVTHEHPGNLIKLPLGLHLKSGNRSAFTDYTLKILQPENILQSPPLNTAEQLYSAVKLLKKMPIKEISVTAEPSHSNSKIIDELHIHSVSESRSAAETLDLERHTQFQWMISRCHPLNLIKNKLETRHELSNQERLVLTHTLGHLEDGAAVVNELLQMAHNISPDDYLKSPLKGNPISCPKIRSRLRSSINPELCNCRFREPLNTYPNPMLHLKELDTSNLKSDADQWKMKHFIESYLTQKQELNDLKKQIDQKEKDLFRYLDEAGISEISTSFGIFMIHKDGDRYSFSLKL